jgi:hypothetical protein
VRAKSTYSIISSEGGWVVMYSTEDGYQAPASYPQPTQEAAEKLAQLLHGNKKEAKKK